jgi:hypothetical protein
MQPDVDRVFRKPVPDGLERLVELLGRQKSLWMVNFCNISILGNSGNEHF